MNDVGNDVVNDALTPAAAPAAPLVWSDLDRRAVDTCRVLAMDAVQKVGNGHPGTAMSLAPAAYLLFQRHLRHDPLTRPGRDATDSSCRWGTPASPSTCSCTCPATGSRSTIFSPCGPGVAAPRATRSGGTQPVSRRPPGRSAKAWPTGSAWRWHSGASADCSTPTQTPGTSPFDWNVWVMASDGDIQEGISAEASSLAGTQRLGNLTVVWDDNRISIEDDTQIAFTEDVCARYRAYGWGVIEVELAPDGDIDVAALDAALTAARADHERPTFMRLRSQIAWPAPHATNTGGAHGTALGADEVAATKRVLGFADDESFVVADDVLRHARTRRRAWRRSA